MIHYPEWYQVSSVKFKIIKYTYRRETMFIGESNGKAVRMLRIHNVQHLDTWLSQFYIFEHKRKYNLYYSLARYKDGIPYGSLNLAKRDFEDWKERHWKEMESYDCLIDIDAGNSKELNFAFYSAKAIRKLFNKCNVPYHVRFSGMGFHFLMPYKFFKEFNLSFDKEDENNVYDFHSNIAARLHQNYSEMIDTNIYDSRRVVKIPYSLALYGKDEYVCYPFDSDDEFNGFLLHQMTPLNKFHNVTSTRKEEHLFNPNGNVNKLLKELKLNGSIQ